MSTLSVWGESRPGWLTCHLFGTKCRCPASSSSLTASDQRCGPVIRGSPGGEFAGRHGDAWGGKQASMGPQFPANGLAKTVVVDGAPRRSQRRREGFQLRSGDVTSSPQPPASRQLPNPLVRSKIAPSQTHWAGGVGRRGSAVRRRLRQRLHKAGALPSSEPYPEGRRDQPRSGVWPRSAVANKQL